MNALATEAASAWYLTLKNLLATSLTERGTTYGKIDFAERGCQITGD
jgi:hypothetical protein